MKRVVFSFVFAAALVALTACGGGDSDFNGTFIGEERNYSSGQTAQVQATFTQNGEQLTGTYFSQSQSGVGASGSVVGKVQGSTVTQLSVTLPTQGQSCTLTGSASQVNGVITAQLVNSCQGGGVTATLKRHQ